MPMLYILTLQAVKVVSKRQIKLVWRDKVLLRGRMLQVSTCMLLFNTVSNSTPLCGHAAGEQSCRHSTPLCNSQQRLRHGQALLPQSELVIQ